MQPEVFKCRKGKSWWYANGCSQVLGVFVCWISRRRGFPQPSVEPMRKKVDARVRTLVFAWVFDAKIQLVRWPRWKEFCDRFAIYLATPLFALQFFRFLEVLEGSSDASINGNVEKWYLLHTDPSIASRSMDKKNFAPCLQVENGIKSHTRCMFVIATRLWMLWKMGLDMLGPEMRDLLQFRHPFDGGNDDEQRDFRAIQF